jgi:hypothetical protein
LLGSSSDEQAFWLLEVLYDRILRICSLVYVQPR